MKIVSLTFVWSNHMVSKPLLVKNSTNDPLLGHVEVSVLPLYELQKEYSLI